MAYFAITSEIIKEAINFSIPVNDEIVTVIPIKYDIIATVPAEPTTGSWITLYFFSLLPFTISPSEKSASASVWCIPVMIIRKPVIKKPYTKLLIKWNDMTTIGILNIPIIKPIMGKRCIFLDMFSKLVSFENLCTGIIVKKEIISIMDLITKKYRPPINTIQENNNWK